MTEEIVLKFDHVLKEFGAVRALHDISFAIRKGEIHCLVGENGAGKSTLMKILSGAYDISAGSIYIDGKEAIISNPSTAAGLGVAVVYQDMNTVEKLSIVDNMVLGSEISRFGFNNKQENIKKVEQSLKEVGLAVSPLTLMENLSIAQKQMVMIAKALTQHAKIIVLDEPTAMLNDKEVRILFQIIAKLKAQEITIIYISHRMEEIYEIGDRVTVLKDGGYVGTYEVKEIPVDKLIVKMVGRELKDVYPSKDRVIGEEMLRVNGLCNEKLKDVSLSLHRGEVLGISGLVGSGRTELLRAIFGADRKMSGDVCLNNHPVRISTPKDAIKNGIGLVPEERKTQGIVSCLNVRENTTMIYSQLHAKFGFLQKMDESAITQQYIEKLNIKAESDAQLLDKLSGGNQQKVVLSKWLSITPEVLLLDEPTQGIDVGAKAEIYQLIDQLAKAGMGVIVVSSDLIEIMNLSNRILVMHDGKISGELKGDDIQEDQIMMCAMGVKSNEAY